MDKECHKLKRENGCIWEINILCLAIFLFPVMLFVSSISTYDFAEIINLLFEFCTWISYYQFRTGWVVGDNPLCTPPPPLPYRAHCRSHGEAGLCFILPCYFSVKGCQNLFSHLFPFTLSSCSFIWRFVPSALLGWICLCSQCGKSTLDKLILNTSYVILFITIKSKWLWAFPIAIFTHVASVS